MWREERTCRERENGNVNDCMTESQCTFHKLLPCVGNLCIFDTDLVTDTESLIKDARDIAFYTKFLNKNYILVRHVSP